MPLVPTSLNSEIVHLYVGRHILWSLIYGGEKHLLLLEFGLCAEWCWKGELLFDELVVDVSFKDCRSCHIYNGPSDSF